MGKVCIACGIAPAKPEPLPPKKEAPEPEKCPNCGKEGTLKEEKESSPEEEE